MREFRDKGVHDKTSNPTDYGTSMPEGVRSAQWGTGKNPALPKASTPGAAASGTRRMFIDWGKSRFE
jgi:hypothetical protein